VVSHDGVDHYDYFGRPADGPAGPAGRGHGSIKEQGHNDGRVVAIMRLTDPIA